MANWVNKGKITGTQVEQFAAVAAWVNAHPEYKRINTLEFDLKDICVMRALVVTHDNKVKSLRLELYGAVCELA